MRYSFSNKQIVKNAIIAWLYSFVISLFLVIVFSNLYEYPMLEIIASFAISISVATFYAIVAYFINANKSFSVDGKGICFYVKNKVVKIIAFNEIIETDISYSMLFKSVRIITLKTQTEKIAFSINFKVYQLIRDYFPIFNDRKEESLINFTSKYKLKTLLMQYCVIVFYFATGMLIVSPIISSILKKYSKFYAESMKLFFSLAVFIFLLIFIGYTLFFFYKFFAYARHTLRYDGALKLEYYKFNRQKKNNQINNVIGIKQVKSIFSFLFNVEQVYIIWKNDKDIVQNDFIPFCLSSEDVQKLKKIFFAEEEKIEPINKTTYKYLIFPLSLIFVGIVGLSILFTPWFLILFLAIAPCTWENLKNRGSFVGEGIVAVNNGAFSKKTYIFKTNEIKGLACTDRFFETKSSYASYEMYIDGYSGVYLIGLFNRDLEQKIVEKIKDK